MILVTGATGKTGKRLVAQLGAKGIPHRIAARSTGFDWTDPATWNAALDGATAAYLVAPPAVAEPYARLIAFAEKAQQAGVHRLVFLGMAGLPAGPFAHGQVHQWLIDHCDDWAVIAPSAFMENFAEGSHLASIRDEDTIYSNTGNGHVPFISADDIARAALTALTMPAPANRAYTVTGSEALSYDEVASTLGDACGRPISHTHITTEQLAERFIKRGLPEATGQFLAASYAIIANDSQAQTTADFTALTGQPPITFASFARGNAALWSR